MFQHKIYMGLVFFLFSHLFLAPSLFTPVMSALRPMLSEQTNDIFDNYADETEWKPVLLDLVDPSQLPPSYGGTKGKPKKKANLLVGTFHRDENGKWWWPSLFGGRN